MIRKRGRSWLGALVLASTLLTAPGVWAAGAPIDDSGTFWTSVEVWFQNFVSGWFGLGAGNTGPEVTYDGAGEANTGWGSDGPCPIGPGSTDEESTDDSGGVSDPDG
jgi:hypothetical protein